jgi:hypothetical protein
MDISFGDVLTGISLLTGIGAALLSTRFVTKDDYKEDTNDRLKWREAIEKRIVDLETRTQLSAQPIQSMSESLKSIVDGLARFVD